jgi:cytohesin
MSGNLTAVQLLLKAGVAPTERDKEHYTPLHWAAAKGHTKVVRKLIEVGAGLEGRGGRFHFTPLHMAAGEGHLETSRLLLDAGAEVDAIDRFHDTPMHWAAWFGHLSVVQLLVERGGDSAAKNKDGNTPRDMAFVKRNEHVVQWFRELQGVMLDRRDILNSSEFPHTLR